MQKVKRAVAAGMPVALAIRGSLGMSVADFARKAEVHETAVSAVINGSARSPYHEVRDQLAAHLGVDREWLDNVLPLPSSEAEAATDAA